MGQVSVLTVIIERMPVLNHLWLLCVSPGQGDVDQGKHIIARETHNKKTHNSQRTDAKHQSTRSTACTSINLHRFFILCSEEFPDFISVIWGWNRGKQIPLPVLVAQRKTKCLLCGIMQTLFFSQEIRHICRPDSIEHESEVYSEQIYMRMVSFLIFQLSCHCRDLSWSVFTL